MISINVNIILVQISSVSANLINATIMPAINMLMGANQVIGRHNNTNLSITA